MQKNSPPKWKAYFVLKFVPLDICQEIPCTIAENIEYLQISEEISEQKCLSEIQKLFFKYNRWESKLYKELSGKCRLQIFMDLGSELLGNPIALFDLSMTMICIGGKDKIRSDNIIWKSVLENNTPPVEILSALKNKKLYQRIITEKMSVTYDLPVTGTQCMHTNIFVDGKRIGSIDFQDICSPFSEKDRILTEYFAELISIASCKTALNKWEHEQQLQIMQKALAGDYCREDEVDSFYCSSGKRKPDHVGK